MSLYLFGVNNAIIQSYLKMIETQESCCKIPSGSDLFHSNYTKLFADDASDFFQVVYSAGILTGQRAYKQRKRDALKSVEINMITPIKILSALNDQEKPYQFIYISSESASKGSFDEIYAASKAGVELVVKEKIKNHPSTQIVALSPSKISDSGMTMRRADLDEVIASSIKEPLGRLISSSEVARLLKQLLRHPEPSLSNLVIPINGGKFARSK